jgi:cell wall-associated NlpC family hydrolase
VFLPSRRSAGFAGPVSVLRLFAAACAAVVFVSHAGLAAADEPAPTVHIRDAAESTSDNQTADELVKGDGQPLYRVDGREIDYPEPTPEPEPAPQPSAGEVIVGFAMGYVGYPYVAAGNTPAGFDCSGFTQWVILNTLGIDIGHAVEGQPAAGAWVDYGAWQPGDLVFFQNTYRAGISHVGIYIGDGLFVHAENEGTGVTISSIYSDYYGSRYWGSVRVA